jgi:hypothetical protein
VKLADAGPTIRAAVDRLAQRPFEAHPFVVVFDTVTQKFVQFCNVKSPGDLRIDCPALGVVACPVPDAFAGALEALRLLRAQDLPEFAELEVLEDGCDVVLN